MGLFNPAGGLKYHLRALRYRHHDWWQFRVAIGEWTAQWVPKSSALALVGPSAGYCIPGSLLSRFETVLAFEPDPIARFLFKKNHPTARIEWADDPNFLRVVQTEKGDRVRVLRRFGLPENTPFVFPNFLGQVEALPRTGDDDLKRIADVVAPGPFLTFHNRLSASWSVKSVDRMEQVGRISGAVLAQHFLSEALPKKDSAIEERTLDPFFQRLSELGCDLSQKKWNYWLWPLHPGERVQIVEGIYL